MSKSTKLGTKKIRKIDNPCCTYDFTLFDDLTEHQIMESLQIICKKFCFQKEQGMETGTIHYQGRLSLKMKKRKTELIQILNKYWKKYHISVTSNENRNNNFYVMKEETKIDGPWDEDSIIKIPDDVKKMVNLFPWQEQLREELRKNDDRKIDIVCQPKGNVGKSSFVKYMAILENAAELPFCNDFKDVMRMAYCVGEKKTYLIDFPRSIPKTALKGFYSAIEKLKTGFAYDDRNKYRFRYFNRPRICIFTNEEPDLELLSKDMWQVWEIQDNQLVKFEKDKLKKKKKNKKNIKIAKDNKYDDLDFIDELSDELDKEVERAMSKMSNEHK